MTSKASLSVSRRITKASSQPIRIERSVGAIRCTRTGHRSSVTSETFVENYSVYPPRTTRSGASGGSTALDATGRRWRCEASSSTGSVREDHVGSPLLGAGRGRRGGDHQGRRGHHARARVAIAPESSHQGRINSHRALLSTRRGGPLLSLEPTDPDDRRDRVRNVRMSTSQTRSTRGSDQLRAPALSAEAWHQASDGCSRERSADTEGAVSKRHDSPRAQREPSRQEPPVQLAPRERPRLSSRGSCRSRFRRP